MRFGAKTRIWCHADFHYFYCLLLAKINKQSHQFTKKQESKETNRILPFLLMLLVGVKIKSLAVSAVKVIHFTCYRSISKQAFKMNTAYFRHVNGESEFHVTFRYVNKEIGIDKQFNFCRRLTENCASFLNRVDSSIEKVAEKKSKRSKAKKLLKDGIVESEQNAPTQKVETLLLCNDNPVNSELPCSEIFSRSAAYALDILRCRLLIEINAPWVETIALPKAIMAGFLVYPCKLESFFMDKGASEWKWFRAVGKDGRWQECGSGETYTAVCADVGHYLKVVCEPRNSAGRCGPKADAVSPSAVEAGPGLLPCEDRHKFTANKTDGAGLRVVSYNILADLYVDSEYSRTILFGYCPNYALELPYRRQLLLKELLGYNADVLCMQEVDSKVFRHDLEPLFSSRGMVGEYSQKGGQVSEGTAVFYDNQKLRCVQSWRVVLSEALQTDVLFAELWARIREQEALMRRVTDRSTTLQILQLESLTKPGNMLLVVNVHLYFHPDADHVRLFQAVLITLYLEHLKQECKRKVSVSTLPQERGEGNKNWKN